MNGDADGDGESEQQLKWEQHYRSFLANQYRKIGDNIGGQDGDGRRSGSDELFDALMRHQGDGFQDNLEQHSLAKAMEITLKYADVRLSGYERNVLSWCQANSEYGCGTNLDATSMVHWKQDEQWNMRFVGGHKMINYGYSPIVHSLAFPSVEVEENPAVRHLYQHLTAEKKAQCQYPSPPQRYSETDFLFPVHRNCPVDKVKWYTAERDHVNKVKVYTKDGDEHVGDAVIVAVPQGVLKRKQIEFVPALPEWKERAVKGMGFGNLNKLVLRFAAKFWGDSMYFHYARRVVDDNMAEVGAECGGNLDFAAQNRRGECFTFWNLHKVTGAPILVALYSGNSSHRFETMSDEMAKSDALNVLRAIFGESVVSEPVAYERTSWGQDEYARGCYAFCAKEADNAYLDMAKPVENVVFFAGEHCCKETPDTVGGAYLTGLRAAGHIERIDKEWPKSKAVEQFPFVAMASTLAKERDAVPFPDRPLTIFGVSAAVRHERTDILRIYSHKFGRRARGRSGYRYRHGRDQRMAEQDQVVRCDADEMEKERKALLSGIFDSVPTTTKNGSPRSAKQRTKRSSSGSVSGSGSGARSKSSGSNGKSPRGSRQSAKSPKTTVDLTRSGRRERDRQKGVPPHPVIDLVNGGSRGPAAAVSVVLPPIKSCIDKHVSATTGSLVDMIDSNDEADALKQKHHSSSRTDRHRKHHHHSQSHSKGSKSHHRSSSKHGRSSSSSSRHRDRRKSGSSSSRSRNGKDSIDLTRDSGGKISGTSSEAMKLLKDGKTQIGHFARKHLSKALSNVEYDKEDFKNIAKKVTTKVFDDFRAKFKATKSAESLDYDKFMASKRKKKVEELIRKYVERLNSTKRKK